MTKVADRCRATSAAMTRQERLLFGLGITKCLTTRMEKLNALDTTSSSGQAAALGALLRTEIDAICRYAADVVDTSLTASSGTEHVQAQDVLHIYKM